MPRYYVNVLWYRFHWPTLILREVCIITKLVSNIRQLKPKINAYKFSNYFEQKYAHFLSRNTFFMYFINKECATQTKKIFLYVQQLRGLMWVTWHDSCHVVIISLVEGIWFWYLMACNWECHMKSETGRRNGNVYVFLLNWTLQSISWDLYYISRVFMNYTHTFIKTLSWDKDNKGKPDSKSNPIYHLKSIVLIFHCLWLNSLDK